MQDHGAVKTLVPRTGEGEGSVMKCFDWCKKNNAVCSVGPPYLRKGFIPKEKGLQAFFQHFTGTMVFPHQIQKPQRTEKDVRI